MQRYSPTLIGFAGSRRMGAALFILAGIFMLKKASNRLSLWAHNNYMSDKTWDWGSELVVITGGCGGIGALVVSKLAAKNIKVVILDIVEPNTKLGKFPSSDSNSHSYQGLCIDFISRSQLCLLQSRHNLRRGDKCRCGEAPQRTRRSHGPDQQCRIWLRYPAASGPGERRSKGIRCEYYFPFPVSEGISASHGGSKPRPRRHSCEYGKLHDPGIERGLRLYQSCSLGFPRRYQSGIENSLQCAISPNDVRQSLATPQCVC